MPDTNCSTLAALQANEKKLEKGGLSRAVVTCAPNPSPPSALESSTRAS
eukprot:gene22700-59374_t